MGGDFRGYRPWKMFEIGLLVCSLMLMGKSTFHNRTTQTFTVRMSVATKVYFCNQLKTHLFVQ